MISGIGGGSLVPPSSFCVCVSHCTALLPRHLASTNKHTNRERERERERDGDVDTERQSSERDISPEEKRTVSSSTLMEEKTREWCRKWSNMSVGGPSVMVTHVKLCCCCCWEREITATAAAAWFSLE
jgi:hypothetical protein